MAFATTSDLETRLGRTFTEAQDAQASMLLDLATSAIAGACDKDDDWAATVTDIPPAVRVVCIEAAVRAMVNPDGVRSRSETLGTYTLAESYTTQASGAGLELTDREERAVRRAVFGTSSATVRPDSLIDDLGDFYDADGRHEAS